MQRPRSPIRMESVTQTLNQVEVLVLKRKGWMWQKTAATHSGTVRATRAITAGHLTLVRMNDPHYNSYLRGIGRMMMVFLNRRTCWAKWWLQFKIVRLKKDVRIVFCTVSIQYYWSELMLITEREKRLWALMYFYLCFSWAQDCSSEQIGPPPWHMPEASAPVHDGRQNQEKSKGSPPLQTGRNVLIICFFLSFVSFCSLIFLISVFIGTGV